MFLPGNSKDLFSNKENEEELIFLEVFGYRISAIRNDVWYNYIFNQTINSNESFGNFQL